MLSYRYDCERAAPTCIAAHPGEPVLAVGVDHNLLILEVSDLDVLTRKLQIIYSCRAVIFICCWKVGKSSFLI